MPAGRNQHSQRLENLAPHVTIEPSALHIPPKYMWVHQENLLTRFRGSVLVQLRSSLFLDVCGSGWSSLPTFRDNILVVSSSIKHLEFFFDCLTLPDGTAILSRNVGYRTLTSSEDLKPSITVFIYQPCDVMQSTAIFLRSYSVGAFLSPAPSLSCTYQGLPLGCVALRCVALHAQHLPYIVSVAIFLAFAHTSRRTPSCVTCLKLDCFFGISAYLTENRASMVTMATKCDSQTHTRVLHKVDLSVFSSVKGGDTCHVDATRCSHIFT
jgi:hypothetical protein